MILFTFLNLFVGTSLAERLCEHCWEREIFTQPAIGLEFGWHDA